MKLYTITGDLSLWGPDTTEDTIITEDELQHLSEEWETPVEELLDDLDERDDLIPIVSILTNGNHWDRQVIYYNTGDNRLYSSHGFTPEPVAEGRTFRDLDDAASAAYDMYVRTIGWEPEWLLG